MLFSSGSCFQPMGCSVASFRSLAGGKCRNTPLSTYQNSTLSGMSAAQSHGRHFTETKQGPSMFGGMTQDSLCTRTSRRLKIQLHKETQQWYTAASTKYLVRDSINQVSLRNKCCTGHAVFCKMAIWGEFFRSAIRCYHMIGTSSRRPRFLCN